MYKLDRRPKYEAGRGPKCPPARVKTINPRSDIQQQRISPNKIRTERFVSFVIFVVKKVDKNISVINPRAEILPDVTETTHMKIQH